MPSLKILPSVTMHTSSCSSCSPFFTFSDYAHFFVLVMLAFFHYTQASMDSNPQLVGVYALPQAETAEAPYTTSCKSCYSSPLLRCTGQVLHYRPVIPKAIGIPADPLQAVFRIRPCLHDGQQISQPSSFLSDFCTPVTLTASDQGLMDPAL
jgi:hypothetical protein